MPGYLFTGFKQLAHVTLVGLVSYPTMEQLINDFNTTLNELNITSSLYNLTDGKGYSYNVPKRKLLVQYAANIT